MNIGYTKPLYILPFDHRATFVKQLLGIEGRLPTTDEINKVKEIKQVIYDGFRKAVSEKVPKENAAIFVDEQFGDEILKDAISNGYIASLAVEKSGQKEFDFEYGNEFGAHIEKYKPTFVKALIRYNPEDNQNINKKQQQKLKILREYCQQHGYKFLLEPLIPPTEDQLKKVNNDQKLYDEELRPDLTIQMIRELQNAGVEPDVWKIEGIEKESSYQKIVSQAQSNNRNSVGIIVLGRGANKEQVELWLKAGRMVKGIIGFAVGRTIFWDPLIKYRDGMVNKQDTIETIAKNYIYFYNVFAQNSL